ncbi:MAG: hypothetical protein ACE5OY_07785 [Candidatus Bathyarchaeia archaeon]
MHPIAHVAITGIAGLLLSLSGIMKPPYVAVAILLTILVDAFDHGYNVLFRHNPVATRTKRMAAKGQLARSYRHYYQHRHEMTSMVLHNVYFALALVIFSLAFFRRLEELVMAVCLGVLLHLLCDAFGDIKRDGYRRAFGFWTLTLKIPSDFERD